MNKIFNEARMAYQGQILSTSEITTLLAEMPKSHDSLFLSTLVKFGALDKKGKSKYTFTSTPVHINILTKVIEEISHRRSEYSKKYNKKNVKTSETKSDVQKAIELLLATGEYEIYKIEKTVNIKKTQVM
jgi:hypothetical protein